jgi:hypoxanthine phosphoribosyltransferase
MEAPREIVKPAELRERIAALGQRISADYEGKDLVRGEIIELSYATHVHLTGVHALILKDICHSGVTENYLITHLAQQHPASLEVAALVNKPKLRRVALEPKYVVLGDVPESRLVGYGMEYEGRWGNLPGVHALQGG